MKRLAVLGASGHGKVVADAAELEGWDDVVFFDDAWPSVLKMDIWPVVGSTAVLLRQLSEFQGVVVAIGDNEIRLEKLTKLEQHKACLSVVVHPSAVISRYAQVGLGSVILATAVVNAGAKLGRGCIINTGAVVEHDCRLDDGVHVSPNASLAGAVEVGFQSWIGAGASVKQSITIGRMVTVGMGAVVIADAPNGSVVVGSPARQMKTAPE